MAGTLSAEVEYLRDRLEALASDVESLEDENAALERRLDELERDPSPEDFLPYASPEAEHLELVIHHLLRATGVYDLADLKDAAHAAGLETA